MTDGLIAEFVENVDSLIQYKIQIERGKMRVVKIKPYVKDTLLGFAELEFEKVDKYGPMLTYNCKLYSKDGNRWLALPSEAYEKDGKKKYFQLNRFNEEGMRMLTEDVFAEYDRQVGNVMKSQPVKGTHYSGTDNDDGLPF